MTAPTATTELKPPALSQGWLGWIRENLFAGPFNTLLTILTVWLLLATVPAFIDWALLKAVWSAPTASVCREAAGGACWAFVYEKHRLILFGLYPFEEHWRPMLVVVIFLAMIGLSCLRRFWTVWLALYWIVALTAVGILMWGGVLGLTYVENEKWGGLPLTLILSVFGIAFAFPLSILLALGRRSNMPAIKALCVIYIELIRGVPLISLLFMASVMLPLFLPTGVNFDKLLRAQIAIILFAAAYLAEVVRGGLQALPKGQYEAADALGLAYWQKTGLIILPQALKLVIPPLVNTFIGIFKDTSLVVIIGLFDLLNSLKASLVDPAWPGFSAEGYIAVSLIYFALCYFMSKYSQALEARLATGHKR
ncbi:MAG: amino acid ABC transporter permease [Alphaproteobacteria bacterium]|nr:amino acid ABC transporter permease [Alphaproteobacteria bacterium]